MNKIFQNCAHCNSYQNPKQLTITNGKHSLTAKVRLSKQLRRRTVFCYRWGIPHNYSRSILFYLCIRDCFPAVTAAAVRRELIIHMTNDVTRPPVVSVWSKRTVPCSTEDCGHAFIPRRDGDEVVPGLRVIDTGMRSNNPKFANFIILRNKCNYQLNFVVLQQVAGFAGLFTRSW